jgi:CheY-like chemotaxis protein
MKVLIIDGNNNTRRVLADYVSRWGARVCSAETGLEAAQIIRSMAGPCNVVIAGAQAPGIDDFLLASPVGACRGLILMLTAGRNPVEIRRRREFGAATLTKPLGQAELLETILRVSAALHDGPNRLARMGASPPSSPAGRAPSRSIRILLAEDNPVNQKVAARLLERDGHRVKVVSNGREAVAALEHEAFELVLMDLEMPVMDGLKTATVIREREQLSGAHLPIIAMTAHAMSGDRDRCLAAGMDDYITKPIRKVDLAQIISHQLGGRGAPDSLTTQCTEAPCTAESKSG